MKSNRKHLPNQSLPGSLPHFQMRFRPILAKSDERETNEVPTEQAREEETLIPDPRGLLRPSEHVERKLFGLLGHALMPVSFFRVTPSTES